MANTEATRNPGELRQWLAVPLFDLGELGSRRAIQRPPSSSARARPQREKPAQVKTAHASVQRESRWTPEGEARRRLAALLAEAAGRKLAAAAAPSWEQLFLPGCAELKARPGAPRR